MHVQGILSLSRRALPGAVDSGMRQPAFIILYICLPLKYDREFSRQMVPDPYIIRKLRARRFDWCIVRLQQRSFRAFIAESIISTVPAIQYGAAEMTACKALLEYTFLR